MPGFDFATTTEESTSTSSDDTEETPDFVSNEVGDLYLSSVDYEQTAFAIMKAEGYDKLKIQGTDTLEDASRLLEKYDEAHPTQRLHMVAALFKSTAGKLQTGQFDEIEENDHSIGLQNSKAPEEHPEEWFSYAHHSRDLPTITWDDLDGGEREVLEEDYDIDPAQLGFDTTYNGPKLLEVEGDRLPIAVVEGDEIQETLEILARVPDVPSGYTEDGFRESSDPSIFGEADVDTDKVADGGSEVNLAANPEAVTEVNVGDIRSEVTDIDSLRTINTMLRVEEESDDPRSSAITRLEERRNAIQSSDDEGEEEVEDLTEAEMNLASALLNNGEASNLNEAKQMVQG